VEDLDKILADVENEAAGFKVKQRHALDITAQYSIEDCRRYATSFYADARYQVRSLGVFILGFIAHKSPESLAYLKSVVSKDENWRVQEILAKAFDAFCKDTGYEQALPVIKAWLSDENPNVRRAVTEGLRIWTGRPYFKDNPQEAIRLLSALKEDESEYVRRSVGNALRDISKKHPASVRRELAGWDLADRKITQVHKLAMRHLAKQPSE
jgi:HEAT repeat protein